MPEDRKAVVWFNEVGKDDIPLVGGKGANLGEMTNANIPVPPGFIVTVSAAFTTISEKIQPEEVIQMLNGIFNIVTQVVYQNFGDIDKFIGDAFLAVFRHPEMALLSAVAIQTSLKLYNDIREIDDMPVALFRMGINFGKVIRGSVGGTIRYDNTLTLNNFLIDNNVLFSYLFCRRIVCYFV